MKLEIRHLVITSFAPRYCYDQQRYVAPESGHHYRMRHAWVRFAQDWRIVTFHGSFGTEAWSKLLCQDKPTCAQVIKSCGVYRNKVCNSV